MYAKTPSSRAQPGSGTRKHAGSTASTKRTSRALTPTEAAEIKQAFDLFDTDRSGSIYYRELKTCLAALGFPAKKADVLSILDANDQDPAEGIDYNTFEQILSSLYIGRTFDDLVDRAFDVFASEGKGHITLKGLRRITKDVGQSIDDEELKDMIRMFDRNEDGVIDKDEFRRILRSLNPDDEDDSDEDI